MKKKIILADSPFHLLLASSLYLTSKNFLIVWIGKDISFVSKKFIDEFKVNIISTENYNFFNVHKNIDLKKLVLKVKKVNYLYTFYDTHFVFEYLKHEFKLPWSRVGLIDDGIANLIKVSMPKLHRRLPKAFYNFLFRRFPVNLSINNLGLNNSIRNCATIYGNFYLKHPLLKKEINIYNEFKNLLKNQSYYNIENKKTISGVIIILSPVLIYKRKTKNELLLYLQKILKYVKNDLKIYFKPHPRENLKDLISVISKLNIKSELLNQFIPLELYFPFIKKSTWLGMPSTSIVNRSILNYGKDEEFVIIQEDNDPFPDRIEVIKNVLKSKKLRFKIIRST